MKTHHLNGFTYFLIALLIFGLLGLEFGVFFITNLVDGQVPLVLDWPANWYALLVHWSVTILIWLSGAYFTYRWARGRGVWEKLMRFNVARREWYLAAAGIIMAIAMGMFQSQQAGLTFPQVWREFRGFQALYGRPAWILSIFQNLYYLVEFTLVVLLLAFFQRAGERWFKADWFPWGSIGLLSTWGSIHLVTNPQGAVSVLVWSLILGIFFILMRKSFYPTLLIGFMGFIF